MTIIAAIRTPDSILMGGDSAQNTGGSITITQNQKVFQNGDYLLGVCGLPRVAELLQYEFRPPAKTHSMAWKEFLVCVFLPKLKSALGARNNLDHSSVLVATKGGELFEVNNNWFVNQSLDPYAAIGSGADYALGSFHSTSGKPRWRLLKAMKAAAHLNAYVRPPFKILELPTVGWEDSVCGGNHAATPCCAGKGKVDPSDSG